ncbi:MAG: hypothetical protein AMJ62_10590 [Myxococcales bacterium SG8_38]|nr:MAG: hypothetical protein AMJ62_10590 [Myxococcales bacterium SG8_38]
MTALLWFSAIGCGLMAGLYFAFSTFIMGALGKIDSASGIRAMQAINQVIQRSLFIVLFFGTTLIAAALSVMALMSPEAPLRAALVAGGFVYLLGMFGCTVAFNVPLNNALDAHDASSPEGARFWQTYLARWTRWNHVRTVASTVSCACYIGALAAS